VISNNRISGKLLRGVEAVEKPVGNFATVNFGEEKLLIGFLHRFMILRFTSGRNFLIDLCTFNTVLVFLQLR
jgi:hypothetical protein